MEVLWQFPAWIGDFVKVGSLGDWATVIATLFVGYSLRQGRQAQELDAFMRLNERWDHLGDMARLEDMPGKSKAERHAWVMMLMSFAELLGCLANSGRLKSWRLRWHFSSAVDLADEWMKLDLPDEATDPHFLPEFKKMRRIPTKRG